MLALVWGWYEGEVRVWLGSGLGLGLGLGLAEQRSTLGLAGAPPRHGLALGLRLG